VVVVWGAAQHTVPDRAAVEGVRFVADRKLVPWLRELDGETVSKDALQRLERYCAGAWQEA
jgi:hypothetical protein